MKLFGQETGSVIGDREFLVEEGALEGFNIEVSNKKLEELHRDTSVKGVLDMHYLDSPWRVRVFFDEKITNERKIFTWLKKEKLI